MKLRRILASLAALAVLNVPTPASAAVVPVGGPPGVTWTPVYAQEFSTTTAAVFSGGRWHPGWFSGSASLSHPVDSTETAMYDNSLFSVSSGIAHFGLHANTTHKSIGSYTKPNLGSAIVTDPSQVSPGFATGRAYFEARMKLPASSGERVWPAWWLNGQNWPNDMEVDVMEGDGTNTPCWNLHWGTDANEHNLNSTNRCKTVAGATTGFHTYAADVRANGVTFYYDGVAVASKALTTPTAKRYLILLLTTDKRGALSGSYTLDVDYVRVWTHT